MIDEILSHSSIRFLNKKILLFAILLASLLAVSAVSAADNATSDAISVETTDEVISVENTTDEIVSVEENQINYI